jgi:hypothetical protein
MSRELLGRTFSAGVGPGAQPLTIDLDSTICETFGLAKKGATGFTRNQVRGYHRGSRSPAVSTRDPSSDGVTFISLSWLWWPNLPGCSGR